MERKDHRTFFTIEGHQDPISEERTPDKRIEQETSRWHELHVSPRELDLITRGLKALRGEVMVRDQVSGRGSDDYPYPPGSPEYRGRNGDVPLVGELDGVLESIEVAEVVEHDDLPVMHVAPPRHGVEITK